MNRLLLRPSEAAEVLGLGRTKTYQLIAAGELPCVRVGGAVRVPAEELREWVQRQARDAQEEHGGQHGRE